MKKLKRIIKKTSFINILFFLMSIVSLTFAWFGLIGRVDTDGIELEVVSWNISFDNDSTLVTVTTDDILPGMDTYKKEITIKNKGDIAATLIYKIKSLRVLDEPELTSQIEIEEAIAEFPFNITEQYSSNTIAPGETKKFTCEISWAYESGNDAYDTEWGERVYQFKQAEYSLYQADHSYNRRKPIEIVYELTAVEQKTINFKLSGSNEQANNGETWGEWILRQEGNPQQGGGLYISDGCNHTDSEISAMTIPYKSDTRANNRYCAVYQNSTVSLDGYPRRARLVNSDNEIQRYNDEILEGVDYIFTYSIDNYPCCFDPGTKVLMANGKEKNIEKVKKGEYVMSYNEKTKMYEADKVLYEITRHNSDDLVYIYLSNGQRIGMRAYHPLLTEDGYKSIRPALAQTTMEVGYKVEQLKIGDKLVGIKDSPRLISIEIRKEIDNYNTYNLSIEKNHNYIANGIVVHNASCPS